jgi:hypothetical protein
VNKHTQNHRSTEPQNLLFFPNALSERDPRRGIESFHDREIIRRQLR